LERLFFGGTGRVRASGMGLFSGTKDWNVVAILYEKKGHLQVNGNRAKGADAEKVRDAVKRHSRSVFWAVFNQKRAFIEGGPGAGREFVPLETLQYIEKQIAKAKSVAQVLTLLESKKTDKAATGWEIAVQPSASSEE
jgi:hypothetical protein